MTRGAAVATSVAIAVIVFASCTDVSAPADHVASLSFDRFPYPSVVAGDTLRDSLGVVAPLHAIAFNTAGDSLPDAAIQYIALDTGVTIGPGGTLFANRTSGTVRIMASTNSLQVKPITLNVARRPDLATFSGESRDTVDYVVPDLASANVSTALGVRVLTNDTTGGITATQGWIVSYQVFFRGNAVAPGDTSVVYLVDGGKRSTIDTTTTEGSASRSLRVRPIGITESATDSVIVIATVRYRGAHVAGSPLRFVVVLRPK
ncbi:MAG: hypothetical protein O2973_12670 [Gemmatimonadetes bacterium]|nr:hypothetical protein [Gemmatimonadota bacterium]